jgi:modulator of FtsH protease
MQLLNRGNTTTVRTAARGVEVNKVLRNTYALLSGTLIFSAITAALSMINQWPHPGLIITLVGYFGLLFLARRFRNSALGIVFVFGLTGFMGLTLGPIISFYLTALPNGGQIVMTAMGGTGIIFVGLSAYALTTRKDFSFLGGMLFAGILVAFLAGLGAIIFSIPALSMAVSAMFILLMSGLILYQTSQIIHGGETNYIMATVTLYVAIYNLFLSLLHLLGIFSSD